MLVQEEFYGGLTARLYRERRFFFLVCPQSPSCRCAYRSVYSGAGFV